MGQNLVEKAYQRGDGLRWVVKNEEMRFVSGKNGM